VLLSAERAARQELETTIGIFEALLESAPIGIAVLDLELRCRQANPMLVTMIGTDRPPCRRVPGRSRDVARRRSRRIFAVWRRLVAC
jgi:PAS domain-containing protein